MTHTSFEQFVGPDHVWCQVFESAKRFKMKRPALFLDRDGVIVEEVHYLHKVADVALIKGAADVIAKANQNDIAVIVVTNQAGIARDMFGWEEFFAVQNRMLELLHEATGAYVDAVYACPFHKTGKEPYGAVNHEARKPNPGMLLRALEVFDIDLKKSWIVGDRANDLAAGKKAGLGGGMHVLTGHGRDAGEVEQAQALAASSYIVSCANSIADVYGKLS